MNKAEEMGKKALEAFKSLTDEPAFANESGIVERAGENFVVLGLGYYPYQFMKALSDIAGEEIAADCMYRFGCGYGKGMYSTRLNQGKEKIDALVLAWAGSTYFGWGTVEIVKVTPEKNIVRVYNSFEARSHIANNEQKASKPVCHYFRGVVAGVMAILGGEEVETKETKCLAMGDEYCEFEATLKY